MSSHAWLIWPEHPVWSFLAVLVLAWVVLYLARGPVHRLVRSVARVVHFHLRLVSHWLIKAAAEVRERNRSVLLAHGRDELGRRIEHEIERVELAVRRNLHGYPVLQRKLLDQVRALEEDYRRHADAPPEAPEWAKIVAAIAKAKPNGDPVVARIIADLQRTVGEAHAQAMREYAKGFASRHRALARLQPELQVFRRTLGKLEASLADLHRRAATIDAQVARYAEMHRRTDKAERVLTKSAAVQLALAAMVLIGAASGMVLNFSLIALPLSEIIDNNRFLGEIPAADLAAGTLVALEAVAGLVLMEALRLTHLIPRLSYLAAGARRRVAVVALVFLVLFAGIEVALALIHTKVTGIDPLANSSLLVSRFDVVLVNVWLGLLLPFALAFVAIPLESLLYALRAVTGVCLVLGFRLLALALRALGALMQSVGVLLLRFYDVLIFGPLALRTLVRTRLSLASRHPAS